MHDRCLINNSFLKREVLHKICSDPLWYYDMPFEEWAILYKHYSQTSSPFSAALLQPKKIIDEQPRRPKKNELLGQSEIDSLLVDMLKKDSNDGLLSQDDIDDLFKSLT